MNQSLVQQIYIKSGKNLIKRRTVKTFCKDKFLFDADTIITKETVILIPELLFFTYCTY